MIGAELTCITIAATNTAATVQKRKKTISMPYINQIMCIEEVEYTCKRNQIGEHGVDETIRNDECEDEDKKTSRTMCPKGKGLL